MLNLSPIPVPGLSCENSHVNPVQFNRLERAAAPLLALACAAGAGCAGHIKARPGVTSTRQEVVNIAGRDVGLTLSTPLSASPTPFLVVFASGDGGLLGVSKAILQHLADRGYQVVGFSSPGAFEHIVSRSDPHPNYEKARDAFASIVSRAEVTLGLPANTPLVITGMSRGASVVVAAAGDAALQPRIVGAVAIALTREFDELTIPDAAKPRAGVKTDEEGRLQTYPAITRLGAIPLAIIQSTNDSYVKSAESRQLLGPDTPTRRLYEVPSSGHSFGGGEEALMRDLDDAMAWIAGHAAAHAARR